MVSQRKIEFKPYNVTLKFVTPLKAPLLSPLKFTRRRQITSILECYKRLGVDESDLEKISHLDMAFDRTSECTVFIPTTRLSAAMRDALSDKTIIVKGFIEIPQDKILIDASSVTLPDGSHTVSLYEYVPEGTQITEPLNIHSSIDLPKTFTIRMGRSKDKGFGVVEVTLE